MSFPKYAGLKESGAEWLGKVPVHWSIDRFKRSIKSCRNGIWGGEATGDVTDIKCVRVADFDRDRLVVADNVPTMRSVTAVEQRERILSRGNLLLEKSGGGENQPVGFVVLFDSDDPAVCSNFVAKIELADRMSPSYWRYCHAAAYAIRLNCRSIKQTSGIQNLDQSQYLDEIAPFPPLGEQLAIASFLDRETTKIDALVVEQRRLVELLREKRQAVISHAVTKGLDPTVPMKPSGIPWLGDIPEHWEVQRVKTVTSFVTSGPRGWSERITETGALFIQSGDLDDKLNVNFQGCKRVYVENDAEAARTQLLEGDVVICVTGAKTGNVAVCKFVPETAYVNQHVCLIRPTSQINSSFLGIQLKSDLGQTYFAVSQYGLKQGLSLENVKEAPVVLPPLREQAMVVDFISGENDKFNSLITEAERAISLLQERRTALISAAVTGKIDVRDFASIGVQT